jgi:hypothetical protein
MCTVCGTRSSQPPTMSQTVSATSPPQGDADPTSPPQTSGKAGRLLKLVSTIPCSQRQQPTFLTKISREIPLQTRISQTSQPQTEPTQVTHRGRVLHLITSYTGDTLPPSTTIDESARLTEGCLYGVASVKPFCEHSVSVSVSLVNVSVKHPSPPKNNEGWHALQNFWPATAALSSSVGP